MKKRKVNLVTLRMNLVLEKFDERKRREKAMKIPFDVKMLTSGEIGRASCRERV